MLVTIAISGVVGSLVASLDPASQPYEPITVQSVPRLELHATKELVGPLAGMFAADPVCTIGACGMDSGKHSLFVVRTSSTEREGGKEVGVYTYDLETLKQIHYQAIPNPSGGLERGVTRCAPWLDTWTGHLLLGNRAAMCLETGDLTLIRGLPERHCERAADPIADSANLLYRHEALPWRDRGVFYLDRKAFTVVRRLSFDVGKQDIVVEGAVGNFILARAELDDSHELIVFEPEGTTLRQKNAVQLGDYSPRSSAVDRNQRRWAVAESAWRPHNKARKRLRIYDVPSLRIIHEFSDEYFCEAADGMTFLPSAPVLLVNPEAGGSNRLVLIDANSGGILSKLRLADVRDRQGVWRPFCDLNGQYIGVYGCTWIQLFRVGGTPRPGG